MSSDWKSSKEAFVANLNGSTLSQINTISAVALCSIAFHSALQTSLNPVVKRPQGLVFLASFMTLVVPLLLSMTLFAESPGWLNVLIIAPTLAVELGFRRDTAVVLPSANPRASLDATASTHGLTTSRQNSPTRLARVGSPPPRAPSPFLTTHAVPPRQPSPSPTRAYPPVSFGHTAPPRAIEVDSTHTPSPSRLPPLPAVTTWRAHMMVMTCLGILAVDFRVFPRSLAKCETFGVSIMDLGVGSFVFSQGVVSAIPFLRDAPHGDQPHYLTSPTVPKLLNVMAKAFPVILLGIVRVILVKGSGYPEHVTEYGVHWNFFITLALVPCLQVLLHPLISGKAFGGKFGPLPVVVVAMAVAFAHQFSLYFGLGDWVRNAPRLNIVSANKEGFASLCGYLAIHLLGVSTGTVVLPESPSYFRRKQLQIARQGLKRRDSNASLNSPGHCESRASLDSQDSDGGRGSPGRQSFDGHRGCVDSMRGDPDEHSTENKKLRARQDDKAAIELFSYTFVWWVLLGFSRLLNIGGGVSRLMANISYVLWITAFNTSFLLGYLLLDLYYHPSGTTAKRPRPKPPVDARLMFAHPGPTDSRYTLAYPPTRLNLNVNVESVFTGSPESLANTKPPGSSPALLEAVNKNGLVIFLLANVLTGLVNLTLPTMDMSDAASMVVLLCYSFVISATAWAFRNHRLWKF